MVIISIDPGNRGAVVGVEGEGRPLRPAWITARHGRGAGGYAPLSGPIHPRAIAAALEHVVERVGEPDLVALEALGVRPGEGARSSATAAKAWGAWQALCEARWPGRVRIVTAQACDRALGLPGGMGRTRKALVLHRLKELARAEWRMPVSDLVAALTPPGASVVCDGASDALWQALAVGGGL